MVVRPENNQMFLAKSYLKQVTIPNPSKTSRTCLLAKQVTERGGKGKQEKQGDYFHCDLLVPALDAAVCYNIQEQVIGPSVLFPLSDRIECSYYALVIYTYRFYAVLYCFVLFV